MNQIITYRFNYPISQLNYFDKSENDFYKQCENFISEFGNYFEENNDNELENTIKRMNQFYIEDDSFTDNSLKNEEIQTNLNDENKNSFTDSLKNENVDEKNNSFIDDSLKNENIEEKDKEIENKFKGGVDGVQTEIEDKKENFISLKMEISTNLLLRLLMALMIFVIVMIIIFIIKIEFKPITDYKIPQNYKYFSIQPPYHNVKKFSIYNKNKSIVSGLNEIKNNVLNKGKEEIKKPITIEEKAEQIVKPVEEQVRLEPVVNVGGNPEGFTPSQFFSSSYSFGDM